MIEVGDRVEPNLLMRLANYTRRDLGDGIVEAVRPDPIEPFDQLVTIGGREWSSAWLQPWQETERRDRRAEMLEHSRGRLGRGRR